MKTPDYEDMLPVRISCVSTAKEYLRKKIWYLCEEDIDKSGRGYYWPRFMRVDQVIRAEFQDIESGRYTPYKNIVRLLVVAEDKP